MVFSQPPPKSTPRQQRRPRPAVHKALHQDGGEPWGLAGLLAHSLAPRGLSASIPPPSYPIPAAGLGGRQLASTAPVILRSPSPDPPSSPRFLASPSPALPRPAPAASRAAPGWPAAPAGRAFTAGWRRGARSPTAGGCGSDLPTGPARRARGRGENFCCGSSGDSSHPCAFLLFLPLLLLLFLLLFLLPEQSRGRHGAARAPPRSPPLPARCIVGSPAHRKRSGPPALAWHGDLAARPSVALIPAPACQSRSVAGEAGSASRLPLMGLEGRRFEIDRSRESSWEKRAPLEAGCVAGAPRKDPDLAPVIHCITAATSSCGLQEHLRTQQVPHTLRINKTNKEARTSRRAPQVGVHATLNG
ncbi:translation initiation factor IF-2-like [Alexandromys fortis]|uniref:translation initiation factor IF-2-like n=1 Tax=Alexandromys fortis TaxID=100897 RepID=UPI00215224E6|nr:translation initiation factor IF-2-like [Microtus fortis]